MTRIVSNNAFFLRQPGSVCWACRGAPVSTLRSSQWCARAPLGRERRLFSSSRTTLDRRKRNGPAQMAEIQSFPPPRSPPPVEMDRKAVPVTDSTSASATIEQLTTDIKRICSTPAMPDELEVLEVLEAGWRLSKMLIYEGTEQETQTLDTHTSSIPGLDESTRESAKGPVQMSISFRQRASAALAESLFDLLRDPKIFISPDMLSIYVRIQVLLGKPEYLPEVFRLYAHKPYPRPSKARSAENPITYHPASSNSPKSAVPLNLAEAALSSAIAVKSLPLCVSVIETTVATPAFRLAHFLRRAGLPTALVAIMPLGVYNISNYLAHNYQVAYDPTVATWCCLLAIMGYVIPTGSLGLIALLTWNDHHTRVRWAIGTRLRERWMREPERAMFDLVAQAWGYKERWKWGDEKGEDWEALREFCGTRGMVLDMSSLLEGME